MQDNVSVLKACKRSTMVLHAITPMAYSFFVILTDLDRELPLEAALKTDILSGVFTPPVKDKWLLFAKPHLAEKFKFKSLAICVGTIERQLKFGAREHILVFLWQTITQQYAAASASQQVRTRR
ncbi:unnamed protein product [Calicophoron daubneyi]|uniref:Uncharacterized protein n=1 Tax=Calicophoron daubneyi TaxID=300641 RepID=A0AAV2T1M4_CALDB